jgi:hypothetical protein
MDFRSRCTDSLSRAALKKHFTNATAIAAAIDVKRPDDRFAGLLFTVFLRMSLACILSVIASVGGVTVGAVSMMRRFLVMPALVVFSCLSMVPRSF